MDLLVETFHRSSIAGSVNSTIEITAQKLWEKTDAIMTDAVTKNLKIEYGIAEALNSTHIPMHLL